MRYTGAMRAVVWWACGAAPLFAQAPAGFSVANAVPFDREEVVLVSLPCAAGDWPVDVRAVRVTARGGESESSAEGGLAPARVLMRWPDGSPSLVQAAPSVSVPRASLARFEAVPNVESHANDEGLTLEYPWVDGLDSTVLDPWGRAWAATLRPDESRGEGGLVWRLGPRALWALRGSHVREGERFLGLRAYLATCAGTRHAELTLILDNDLRPPLGPVRFRSWDLVSSDARLRFLPRMAVENGLSEPLPRPEGGFRQRLLGPDRHLFLGDGTKKAFRFDLYWSEGESDADRRRAHWRVRWPLRPLAELADVRRTGAFGAHGGPAPQLVPGLDLTSQHLAAWRRQARTGPLAGFGDPEDAAAQGTVRNGPSVLHNVLRWQNPEVMVTAEAMVLQHLLRPPPGREPALPEDTAAFREGLGPEAIAAPHGFTPLDYEHFAVGLLFDWYWLTGDELALDELRRMGAGLRPLLAGVPFHTCRGEGWCLQAAAMIARATADASLVADLVGRLRRDVWPEHLEPIRGVILAQPPHPDAFGGDESFDAPWQMAALVHGLDAALRAPGLDRQTREALVEMIEQVAVAMGWPGWLDGAGPKYLVSERGSDRYIMEAREDPLGGAALLQVGGMVLASERVRDVELANRMTALAREIAQHALAGAIGERLEQVGATPWMQLPLDRGWGRR